MTAPCRSAMLIVVVVLAAIATAIFWRPVLLMLPKSTIEAYLVRKLPPQTSKKDVLRFAHLRRVKIDADVHATESRFIRLHLGHYRLLFRTDVVAFVQLDSNDRVVTIKVKKYTDSM